VPAFSPKFNLFRGNSPGNCRRLTKLRTGLRQVNFTLQVIKVPPLPSSPPSNLVPLSFFLQPLFVPLPCLLLKEMPRLQKDLVVLIASIVPVCWIRDCIVASSTISTKEHLLMRRARLSSPAKRSVFVYTAMQPLGFMEFWVKEHVFNFLFASGARYLIFPRAGSCVRRIHSLKLRHKQAE